MQELRAIPEFDGLYSITRDGHVWSHITNKFLKPFLIPRGGKGYFGIKLRKDMKYYNRPIHRLVAETWIGPRPDGMQICHCDGDSFNNDVGNLRYDTPSENYRDREIHDMDPRGEKNGMSRFTERDILSIRAMLRNGLTQSSVAKAFGTDQGTVSRIASGKSWGHVK